MSNQKRWNANGQEIKPAIHFIDDSQNSQEGVTNQQMMQNTYGYEGGMQPMWNNPMGGNGYMPNGAVGQPGSYMDPEIYKQMQSAQIEVCKQQEIINHKSQVEFFRQKALIEYKSQDELARQKELIDYRLEKKLHDEERKRGLVDEVQITAQGVPVIITKSIAYEASPRIFTNMIYPKVSVLWNMVNPSKEYLQLECAVEGIEKILYLDSSKILKGSYLREKLAGIGVYSEVSDKKTKELMHKLLIILSSRGKTYLIPPHTGWVKRPDKQYIFVSKEDLTWENVIQLGK